ncbi:hypothetical protein [Subtercola boreus]|uniref:hypothetical protein n=1 Tax=Subtercola boreus TaxID=120213 RepID=UPI001558C058|nr:hypothetical protein [Subtercola boreus]
MNHPTSEKTTETDRIETAEDILEEEILNTSLAEQGLLPVPDATPSDGPAPAA